jgi:hypothetical protein
MPKPSEYDSDRQEIRWANPGPDGCLTLLKLQRAGGGEMRVAHEGDDGCGFRPAAHVEVVTGGNGDLRFLIHDPHESVSV